MIKYLFAKICIPVLLLDRTNINTTKRDTYTSTTVDGRMAGGPLPIGGTWRTAIAIATEITVDQQANF
ncbi:hypothetical protein [Sphingobacterium faecale]|uniref:Uncharacterized protein n=1 Tax=Sphingobacterium faecale TaxID=2803775 RepID=A0ABS1R172_9SPHI|nr:hypothetical protein [Sphingobacterium faecale]MBL1407651.1 hypothetical protein [Sphingobacterium faecale]